MPAKKTKKSAKELARKAREEGPTEIAKFILSTMKAMGWTRYQLAKACGWFPSDIYSRLRRRCDASNAEKMLKALGVKITAVNVKGKELKLGGDHTTNKNGAKPKRK